MFAGILSINHENSGKTLTGMMSKEGEIVQFVEKFKISDDPRINVWLGKIETQMQNSLA